MSVYSGPSMPTAGLALRLDATNPKSAKGRRSLINWNNWTVGTGGVSGYGANGQTAENQRLVDTNPWGISDVVWGSYPSGDGNADGGWDGSYFPIDRTKLYRFSTWIRRTSSTTGGTFYLGTNADGEGVRRTDNGAVQGNPYWDCRNISWMTQNQWYLVTGHIYPADSTYTGRHPDSGVYTVSGGRFGDIGGCNIGNDLKWGVNCTSAMHRSYHYYCPDSTSRLQWYQPRVDLCDGSEPSIAELLANVGNIWYDTSGNNNHCVFGNIPNYTSGYYTFNGTSNYGTITNNSSLNFSSNQTLVMVLRHTYTSGRKNPWDQAYGGYGTWTHEQGENISQYFGDAGANGSPYIGVGSPTTPRSVWNIMCATRDTTQHKWYINGTLSSTTAHSYADLATTAGNITIANGYAGYWQGDMAAVYAYTNRLTDAEVLQLTSAIRTRFGL